MHILPLTTKEVEERLLKLDTLNASIALHEAEVAAAQQLIRVDVNFTIQNGTEIKFKSPVDCSEITGLVVYYLNEENEIASQEFAFADAHGNNIGNIPHLFASDAAVKVILDVDTGMAFVQNADTNAYIESTFLKVIEQDLTEEQKQQARENIGAADENTFAQSVADWNQNDETALDYIKNRTHYSECKEIEWIPYGTYEFASTKNATLLFSNAGLNPEPIVAGLKYKVKLDGVVTEYTAIQEPGGQNTFGSDTMSSASGNGALGFVAGDSWIYLPYSQTGAHTLEITYYTEPIYHQLDENFIPTMKDTEAIALLVKTGFINVPTDSDGDILTNANGDILIF